jgi:hypothetical protein
MKKTLLVLVLLSLGLTAVAQEKITEGIILSKQTMSSDNDQANLQLAQMGDIITTTYFKNDKSRSEASNPMSGDIVTIIDGESKQMLMLMDSPMGKAYTLVSIEVSEEDLKDLVITKGEATKTVLGYECEQYFIDMSKDGIEMKMEIFATKAISAYSKQTAAFGDKFKGFPMYLTMSMNQMGSNMLITNEVTEIKREVVSSDIFGLTPPEDYEEIKQ